MECVICREDFADAARPPVAIACGHVFHRDCLERWFAGRSTCPTCRAPCHPSERGGTRLFLNMTAPAGSPSAGAGGAAGAAGEAPSRAQAEASMLMRQLDCAQRRMEDMRAEAEGLQEVCGNLEQELQGAEREHRGALRRVEELERSLKYSREDVRRLGDERKELARKLKDAETAVANNRVMTDTSLDEAALNRLIRGKDARRVIENQLKTIAARNKLYADLLNELESTKQEFQQERRALVRDAAREREEGEARARELERVRAELRQASRGAPGGDGEAGRGGGRPASAEPPSRGAPPPGDGDKENLPLPAKRARGAAPSEMPAPSGIRGVRVRNADARGARGAGAGASLQNGFARDPVRSVGRDNVVLEGPDGRGGLKKVVMRKGGRQLLAAGASSSAAAAAGRREGGASVDLPSMLGKREKRRERLENFFDAAGQRDNHGISGSAGALLKGHGGGAGRREGAAGRRGGAPRPGDHGGLTIKHFYSGSGPATS